MTTAACPSAIELTAAFSNGPSSAVRQHVAICTRCADEWREIDRVVNSYRKLSWQDSSSSRVEEQRTALLASAALAKPTTNRRWVRWAAPAVAAAAIALVVIARPAPSTSPESAFHGVLTPHGAAAFNRISTRPDEQVSLVTGSLSVEVSPLSQGERFRIVTTDAEVEVRGTAFEVSADQGRLLAVHVWHGRVEVRPTAGAAVVLGGGESWARPAITAGVTSTVPSVATPPAIGTPPDVRVAPSLPSRDVMSSREVPRATDRRRVSTNPRSSTTEPAPRDRVADPGALAYQEGWSALRAGDHASAAKAFERAATSEPRSTLTEDAWYWRAVSLARSNRSADARAAFAAFLERYRGSPRAPQASAMLGWLLFEQGDLDGAEVRFRAAAADVAPTVRDSANQGLDAVRKRRGP